ncbi:MAG TPA: hypothetical protein VGK90_12775 [Rhizomicrobium sp.]|jgi:hypothetical protein
MAAAALALLVLAPVLAEANQPKQSYQPAALWEWNENVITDSKAQADFFSFAGSHGVNRVYIECESAIQNNQAALIAFLETAADQGIKTELLFGDDKWVFPGSGYPHQGYAISLTSKYAAQLLSQMSYGQPVAVHYDVEPADLKQWKTERNKLATDYIELVTRLERAAHKIGLSLSVDVTYWYSTIQVKRHGVSTPMNQLIINAVDRYVIMDYWDTASRMESQATTDLTYANGIFGKEVVIGALTNCNQKPADTSFCNDSKHSGTAWMESVLGKVVRTESPNISFSGLAIEDYAGFKVLGP